MRYSAEKNVYLISIRPDFKNVRISTFIVVATKGNRDMSRFDAWLKEKLQGRAKSVLVSDALMRELRTNRQSIVLTDDYAPVDNLIAPIFEERFGYNRKHRKKVFRANILLLTRVVKCTIVYNGYVT